MKTRIASNIHFKCAGPHYPLDHIVAKDNVFCHEKVVNNFINHIICQQSQIHGKYGFSFIRRKYQTTKYSGVWFMEARQVPLPSNEWSGSIHGNSRSPPAVNDFFRTQ